jgi:tryptophan 2,3-dioxygenase
MSVEQTYKTIDRIIEAQKKARRENDYLTLMTNGEALLEFIPELIIYSIGQESEYRKMEAKLSDEYTGDKRNSSAYCETQAKASEFYKEWQKTKMFMELMYEMVNMAKALGRGLNSELNATPK